MGKKQIRGLIVLLLIAFNVSAQRTTIYTETALANYNLGLDLYARQKYAAAQELFYKVIEATPDVKTEIRKQAEFYVAMSASELFNADAEHLLTRFIAYYPESAQNQLARFQLAKLYYRENKHKKSQEWFEKTDPDALSENQLEEYYFKLGYSYLRNNQEEKALATFAKVKDGQGDYAPYATYYYGHIQYEKGNYESALQHFEKLKEDETFGDIVPFYIAHIFYLQKRYDRVVSYTEPLIEKIGNSKRAPELAKLIGESYFNLGKFEQAIPYLELYNEKGYGKRTREDDYQLGFAYFKANRLKDAIPFFEKAAGEKDAIGQNASYHLGWCYLQSSNKKFARTAFQTAALADHDTVIKQQALFDYAKLSYELGLDPYDEAIRALQDYINRYPYSERLDEAYTFLANIYMTTKNYRTALLSLDRIKVKNDKLKTAYQRVAFFRGIELFNDRNYQEAINTFELSLKNPINKEFTANANYWKGEALYRLGKYNEAVKSYEAFVYAPGAFNLPNFHRVNYHIAYSHYQLKDYGNAIIWFKKYLNNAPPSEARLISDAQTRIADAYFVNKDYANAIDAYEKAVRLKGPDADYSLYQKSLAQGVAEQFDAKIASLNLLINNYPQSKYIVDGKFELAKTQQIKGNDNEAFVIYKNILEQHPNHRLTGSAMVQMGLIRYNQQKDEEALALYKEVVSKFPGTTEAAEAQLGIKRIYVESGSAMQYAEWVKSAGLQGISRTELDSSAYEAAENTYLRGNCEAAIKQMGAYIKDFPEGIFLLNAHHYKADCELKSGNEKEALASYKVIINSGRSRFTANALLNAGQISRKNQPEEAITYFRQLEEIAENADQTALSQSALMQLYSKQGNNSAAAEYARKVLRSEKSQEAMKNEARLIVAKDLYAAGQLSEASDAFRPVMNVNSAIGAEARYYMALILHRQGEYARCEKAIFDMVDKFASYDHWIAKSFVLLAENYIKLDNITQARFTLNSVIDNHEGEEVVKEAREVLERINQEEQRQRSRPELPPEQLGGSSSTNAPFDDNN